MRKRPSEDDVIEPDELEPGAAMRPDVKQGSEGGPPPQSAEENKQDKLAPSLDDLPLAIARRQVKSAGAAL